MHVIMLCGDVITLGEHVIILCGHVITLGEHVIISLYNFSMTKITKVIADAERAG